MSNELIRKMASAFSVSFGMGPNVGKDEVDAMRAALAVLADNVTDEMVFTAAQAFAVVPLENLEEVSLPARRAMKKTIAAAIREAGK